MLNDGYKNLSKDWYQRRGELYRKNFNREQCFKSDVTDINVITHRIKDFADKETSDKKKIK